MHTTRWAAVICIFGSAELPPPAAVAPPAPPQGRAISPTPPPHAPWLSQAGRTSSSSSSGGVKRQPGQQRQRNHRQQRSDLFIPPSWKSGQQHPLAQQLLALLEAGDAQGAHTAFHAALSPLLATVEQVGCRRSPRSMLQHAVGAPSPPPSTHRSCLCCARRARRRRRTPCRRQTPGSCTSPRCLRCAPAPTSSAMRWT